MTQQIADPKQLYEILSTRYNIGELRTLSFQLGVDYEDLAGDNRAGKALELVLYAQRRGRLDDVANYIDQTRHDVQINKIDRPAHMPPPIITHTTTYHVGTVIGGAVGDGATVHNQQVAGRDVSNNEAESVTPATNPIKSFEEQLYEVANLLQAARANEEFADPYHAQIALDDLEEVRQALTRQPINQRRIVRRLQDIADTTAQLVISAATRGKTLSNLSQTVTMINDKLIPTAERLGQG
jgi:hypothetical protein